MAPKAQIEISEEALAAAEKNAADNGFASANEYIESLLLDDDAELDAIARQPWFQKKIEEGLASPIVGELTPELIDQLVQEGIARAQRRK
jgi:16S rRNA G1207 methylase RsmC